MIEIGSSNGYSYALASCRTGSKTNLFRFNNILRGLWIMLRECLTIIFLLLMEIEKTY